MTATGSTQRNRRVAGVVSAGVVALLMAAGGRNLSPVADAHQAPASPRSLADGIYTAAQADRGSEAYRDGCAHCHSTDLLGDPRQEIPSLAESDFMARWGNRSVGELFEVISTDMPADKPGQLSARQYRDILAYMLQVNGFPAGTGELPDDRELLKSIDIHAN